MDDLFLLDLLVASQHLLENMHRLVLWQPLWVLFDAIGQRSTLKQFHHKIHNTLMHDHLHQFDDILMACILEFAKIA